MEARSQFRADQTLEFVEARRHPRFKLEVDIRSIRATAAVFVGDTVDISESGISAMLREEVPVGEVVRLEFTLPLGDVEVLALVRQRSAFRYGFQFVEDQFGAETSSDAPAASLRWNNRSARGENDLTCPHLHPSGTSAV